MEISKLKYQYIYPNLQKLKEKKLKQERENIFKYGFPYIANKNLNSRNKKSFLQKILKNLI